MSKISRFFKKALLLLTVFVMAGSLAFAAQKDSDSKKKKKESDRTFFDRFWELGVSVDVSIANNYFALLDFFHETVVINMNDIYDTIGVNGLTFDVGLGVHVFTNVLGDNFSGGLDIGVDPTINFALTKDTIGFIANGNKLDESMKIGAGIAAAAYVDADIPVSFKVGDNLKLYVTPSYFIPLVYVPYADVALNVKLNSDGTASVTGSQVISAYSALPIDAIVSGDPSSINPVDVVGKGGFDITVAGEFKLFDSFILGASATNIPIFPSKLSAAYQYKVGVNYTMESSILAQLMNGTFDTSGFANCYTFEPVESDENSSISVFRPLKFGFWVDWHIMDDELLVVTPFMQMRFLDATVGNDAGFGFDYAVRVYCNWKFLRTAFTSSYIDNIFKQQLDLAFNLRFFELDLVIASEATSFAQSFCGSGVGVGLGIIFGF